VARCRSVGSRLVALAALLLAAGCSGDFGVETSQDETLIEAVPWSTAKEGQRLVGANTGRSWSSPRAQPRWIDLDLEPADLLVVKPLDMLGAVDPGEPRSSDAGGSVYEVMVPGAVGVKGVSFWATNPDIAARVARQERRAEVRLARNGGVEIAVDLSDAAAEVMKATQPGADEDVRMTLHWTVTTSPRSVAPSMPVDVADWASCRAE
jgi:hypothetical protein